MKLKAYTVMELMVVSMLSVLIVVAAINVIGMFQQQFASYEKDTSMALQLSDLQVLLQEDFFKSNQIERLENNLTFDFPDHTVRYQMESDFIVREINTSWSKRDTMPIAVESMLTYFNQEEILEGSVSGLQISILHNERPFLITIEKELDAKILISETNGY